LTICTKTNWGFSLIIHEKNRRNALDKSRKKVDNIYYKRANLTEIILTGLKNKEAASGKRQPKDGGWSYEYCSDCT
jgi:hypothetical protein